MKWSGRGCPWKLGAENVEPVVSRPKSTINSPNRPTLTQLCAALTSLVAVVVDKPARQTRAFAVSQEKREGLRDALRPCGRKSSVLRIANRETTYVSRQSSNSSRRKRTSQSPGRVQAGDRREIRHAILHHKFGRRCCSSISLRGMGTDRAEACRAFHLQPHQEEILEQDELLGTSGRDGRAGSSAHPATVARCGADQGRGRGDRISDVPGSPQPGSVSAEEAGRKVHARRRGDARRTGHLVGEGSTDTPQGVGHGGGREASHVPVLLKEAIDFLNVRRGGTYIDATVGLGGHSYEIARRLGAPGHLIGVDKDPAALKKAQHKLTQGP